MIRGNAKALLGLFRQPAAAMGEILDQGSLLFASVAVLAVTLPLYSALLSLLMQVLPGRMLPTVLGYWAEFSFYTPLLLLTVVYVPSILATTNLTAQFGGVRATLQRDYVSLLTCSAMAWSAAALPVAVAGLAGRAFPVALLGAIAVLAFCYFAVLMFFAVRTVLGTDNSASLIVVGVSWIPLAVVLAFWQRLSWIFGYLASPFFLFFAFYYLRDELRSLGTGLRTRQSFRRMLEAAAVNPHDADAQYQLGLIHQQRHQTTEAAERFRKAIAIDPGEIDAHFQLGRIDSQQGRFDEALSHFRIVLEQNEKHSFYEIRRELGAVLLATGQLEDARRELAVYVEQRAYDPEGLYYYGLTLEQLGDLAAAREMHARAIEAARSTPHYRRSAAGKWSRLAQKQMRRLPGASE